MIVPTGRWRVGFVAAVMLIAVVGCGSKDADLRALADREVDDITQVVGSTERDVDRSSFDRVPLPCGGGDDASIVRRNFSADAPGSGASTLAALVRRYRSEGAELRLYRRSGSGRTLLALAADERTFAFLTITDPPTRIWGQIRVSSCPLAYLMDSAPAESTEIPVDP